VTQPTLLRNKLKLSFAEESVGLPTTALKNGKGCYGSNELPSYGCSLIAHYAGPKHKTHNQSYWFGARVLPGTVLAQVSRHTASNRRI